jgi:hypothetical protein
VTARRTLVLALGLIVSSAAVALAQRVSGVVRDSISDMPVGGAVVWLSDSTGASVARSIGDQSGAFTVLRALGATRIHVVRIGYRPHDAPLPSAESGILIRLEAIPAFLTAVEASNRRMCPGDAASLKGFELWEQARAALLASVVAREAHPPRIRLISFARTRDPVLDKVKDEQTTVKEMLVERSYVAAQPAWAFAYRGYMREESAGERVYYAPDNETLLDPSFAGTHCLQMARNDRHHPDQVGIAFEPVDDPERDTLVDVSGVLWLDRKTPALKSLEFRYTNLEPDARESGGEIFFRVMPNGASMIERWMIHTALLAVDMNSRDNRPQRAPLPRPLRRNVYKIGVREVGGEVASVHWKDGSTWHGPLPRITGVLTEGGGIPVAGARVWMAKTRDTVITDADGRFELPYVLPGVYAVLASDSTFAPSGLSRSSHYWVYLERGRPEDIKLFLHPRSVILQQLCQAQTYSAGTGVVIGQVLGTGGMPLANAKIDVWRRITSGNVELYHQEGGGTAGADGRFVICGTPLDEALRIRASGTRESAEIIIDKWKDEVFMATLVVRGG